MAPSIRLNIVNNVYFQGFQVQFGITVFGYLTNQRMEQAHHLLHNRELTVAEVANIVGYSHLGHFAAAFKRKYGITAKDCSV
jgi:AraC-like DNA-binding protein